VLATGCVFLIVSQDKWEDLFNVLAAITSIFLFIITGELLLQANKISKYLADQNDRELFKQLYLRLLKVRKEVFEKNMTPMTDDTIEPFRSLLDEAELYNNKDICNFIRAEIDELKGIKDLSSQIYNSDGTWIDELQNNSNLQSERLDQYIYYQSKFEKKDVVSVFRRYFTVKL
jgi:hypothetical protein